MREIGFLSKDGVAVSHACRTSGGGTDPMKERAIVIFELEEKKEKEKKNRAEVMELTAGRDGEQCGIFKLRQNGSCAAQYHLTKGYPTLVSSFNAYNKHNARNWVSDDTT